MPELAARPQHRRGILRIKRALAVLWGRWGEAGEVVLEEGDIFNIPTGIFRGFENIGTDYGMIMAFLGGDDAGGGVLWHHKLSKKQPIMGFFLEKTANSTTPRKVKNFLTMLALCL